jgi:hypothetical protein
VVTLALAFQLYYNFRVTRSPFRLPYLGYENTYAVCPPFIWLPRSGSVPEYQNAPMHDYYLNWELPAYERQRTASGLIRALGEKSWNFLRNYLHSFALAVPIALGPLFWRRDRLLRRATLLNLGFTLVVFGNLWFFPHYAAPACALYLVVLARSMRGLNRAAPIVVRIVLLVHVATFIYAIAQKARAGADGWNYTRAELIAGLEREGGRHLVIVRPGPDRYAHNEWVYNGADIDGSAVVFARDLGEPENRALLDYFSDRTVWLLEVGVRFEPYHR